jgi:hypothetical protein
VAEPASFRDPAGTVFRRDDVLYRQINRSFKDRWEDLDRSKVLVELQSRGLLVEHEVVSPELALDPRTAAATIRPEIVPFISYPYEWTFGELKDAALLTLEAQSVAAARGFTLRDATAFNVQFLRGKPILIDTLSFERAAPDAPWRPYRQFCEQFIAPLALMAHRDPRSSFLLQSLPDGIPLALAAGMLPIRTRLSGGLGPHIHLHARGQKARAAQHDPSRSISMSAVRREALLDSLRRTVDGLRMRHGRTIWTDYGEGKTSYSPEAVDSKDQLVREMLTDSRPAVVWDLGANLGRYSRIAADAGARVIALESDPVAANRHYERLRADEATEILPLVQDVANPSPRIGWANKERASLLDRADADVVMALALVHHLAIARNVPLTKIASLLADMAPRAIVEWIPPDDPMVREMLVNRQDVLPDYTFDGFMETFGRFFEIVDRKPIDGTSRQLTLWRKSSG